MPLYMITYPMAVVGACQLCQLAETDRTSAVHNYKSALLLGNTRPMSEMFRVVGLTFPFSREAVEAAAQFVVDQSQKLTEFFEP